MTASVQPDASTEAASVPTHLVPQAIDHQPPPMGIVAGQIDTLAPANSEQEPAGPPPRDHVAAKMLEDPADLGMLQREEAGDDAGRNFGERGHAAIVPGPGADQRTGSTSSSTEALDAAVEAAISLLVVGTWPAVSRDGAPFVPVDDIARAAVTAAWPIIAAAVEAQARADGAAAERERIAGNLRRHAEMLRDARRNSFTGTPLGGSRNARHLARAREVWEKIADALDDQVAAIARAGTSGVTS